MCHYTLTVKGSHLATHGALTESKRWGKILMIFFVEVSLAEVGQAVAGHLCVSIHMGQSAAAVGRWIQVCSVQYSSCVCAHAFLQTRERKLALASPLHPT